MGRLENAKTFEFEIISNSSVDCMVSVGNLAILLNKLISVQPYVKTLSLMLLKITVSQCVTIKIGYFIS